MILDYLTEFCAEEDVTTAIGTAQVGDSLDMSAGVPIQTVTRLGEDGQRQMHVHVTVTTAFASAGAATVRFGLMSDAQDPITPASATVHALGATIPIANLTAGTQLFLTFPMVEGERYYGITAEVGTAALTAGAITAGLVFDRHGNRAYPDAQN